MGRNGQIHDHPALGRYAVCRDGKIGRVEKVVKNPDGSLVYFGSRVADDTRWKTKKPVFLSAEETLLVNSFKPETIH